MGILEGDQPDAATLQNVSQLLGKLSARLAGQQITERILQFDEDVLGAYFYRRPAVSVFWTPIAILSATSGLSIESLAFVALTHELAHAYTHVGLDINGEDWDTTAFGRSTDELVEGFAQHYTERVCEHFKGQFSDGLNTFLEVRKHQPAPYTRYSDWPQAKDGETMRLYLREASERRGVVPAHEQ